MKLNGNALTISEAVFEASLRIADEPEWYDASRHDIAREAVRRTLDFERIVTEELNKNGVSDPTRIFGDANVPKNGCNFNRQM